MFSSDIHLYDGGSLQHLFQRVVWLNANHVTVPTLVAICYIYLFENAYLSRYSFPAHKLIALHTTLLMYSVGTCPCVVCGGWVDV